LDGAEPFENIIECVEECVEFAKEAERLYSPEHILVRALRIVSKIRLYHDDLEDWKKKAIADKTWPKFKEFMVEAQAANCEMQQNNKQAGYRTAAEQFELLANLMTASASNNNSDNKLLTEILNRFKTFEKKVDERFKSMVKIGAEGDKKPWVSKDTRSYCHTHGYKVGKSIQA
jgi:hypothetical protein